MIRIVTTNYLSDDARLIREEVFVKEQGFINEFDDIDDRATHLVVYDGDIPIACCRYFSGGGEELILGRIAVLKEYRGRRLGQKIIREAEKAARNLGVKKLSLSAQVRVKDFYAKQGFVEAGELFLDECCPHINMEKYL